MVLKENENPSEIITDSFNEMRKIYPSLSDIELARLMELSAWVREKLDPNDMKSGADRRIGELRDLRIKGLGGYLD